MKNALLLPLVLIALGPVVAEGQQVAPEYLEEIQNLMLTEAVMEALEVAEQDSDWAVAQLIELTEIPAPPFMEEARGIRFAELLLEFGADSVWTDEEGNVIGLRRGRVGERRIGFGGHLDTVFPEGTDVSVRQVGDTLFAPGVSDDTNK